MDAGKVQVKVPQSQDLGDTTITKKAEQNDVDTMRAIMDSPKVRVFIDKELCKDLGMVQGQVTRVCQITLNGFTFTITPGSQEIPQIIADLIFSSPENGKYARYGGMAAPKPGEFTGIHDYQPPELAQNMQAVQQFNWATNPYGGV